MFRPGRLPILSFSFDHHIISLSIRTFHSPCRQITRMIAIVVEAVEAAGAARALLAIVTVGVGVGVGVGVDVDVATHLTSIEI